jgi:pimeloyl-ACP methyl ester carboxylesterase
MKTPVDHRAVVAGLRKWRRSLLAIWCVFTILVFAQVVLPLIVPSGGGVQYASFYVRNNQDRGVIIFVHGVLGDSKSTWTNPETHAYWPELLTKDTTFDHYNVYVYGFPSPIVGVSYTIDELADNMRLVLNRADVLTHNELIFLSHSMGGLVTRALLLKYRELIPKIGFLYFYSTPTTGSELANIAQLISNNPQFKGLFPMGSGDYVDWLQSEWLAAKLKVRSYCSHEKRTTSGLEVVTRQSATNLCTEPLVPILEDHISIVKPADPQSSAYIAFKDAFIDAHALSATR